MNCAWCTVLAQRPALEHGTRCFYMGVFVLLRSWTVVDGRESNQEKLTFGKLSNAGAGVWVLCRD
jgi:hypothetical protein